MINKLKYFSFQDAKSDRVKQLLKETEKYLQKLGSKLKEAKVMADMDGVNDSSDFTIENEDETDQAKVLYLLLYICKSFT